MQAPVAPEGEEAVPAGGREPREGRAVARAQFHRFRAGEQEGPPGGQRAGRLAREEHAVGRTGQAAPGRERAPGEVVQRHEPAAAADEECAPRGCEGHGARAGRTAEFDGLSLADGQDRAAPADDEGGALGSR